MSKFLKLFRQFRIISTKLNNTSLIINLEKINIEFIDSIFSENIAKDIKTKRLNLENSIDALRKKYEDKFSLKLFYTDNMFPTGESIKYFTEYTIELDKIRTYTIPCKTLLKLMFIELHTKFCKTSRKPSNLFKLDFINKILKSKTVGKDIKNYIKILKDNYTAKDVKEREPVKLDLNAILFKYCRD